MTMNYNVDDQMGYGAMAWTLAGKFKKLILTPDFLDDEEGYQVLAKKLTAAIIEHT